MRRVKPAIQAVRLLWIMGMEMDPRIGKVFPEPFLFFPRFLHRATVKEAKIFTPENHPNFLPNFIDQTCRGDFLVFKSKVIRGSLKIHSPSPIAFRSL